MSKVKGKKVVRRSKRRKTVTSSPASLPPQVPDVDASAAITTTECCGVALASDQRFCSKCGIEARAVPPPDAEIVSTNVAPNEIDAKIVAPKKKFWEISKDTACYQTTMKILAMRVAGIDDKTIADTLKLSMQTVWNYCYIAGKNNWGEGFANAKDQIEFAIMPKVVRELESGLDDQTRHVTSGMPVAKQMALAIAAGTVFKKFDQATDNSRPISNVIAIRIEHAPGAIVDVREENIGGTPAYQDGEVTDEFLPEGQ